MTKRIILIVDDDESIRSQMRWALLKDYEIFEAGDHASALELTRKVHPFVVILDLGLPPKPREAEEGLKTLSEILIIDQRIKVIIVSGNTERVNALKAIELGAFDFFTKPPVIDEVRIVIKRALRMAELEEENQALQSRADAEGLDGILGNSSSMNHVYEIIRKVATVDVPVLILGETGTGKELTAKAIHRLSDRRDKPFVVINCGAIPETLLESELFGHEKGAFTGASSRRKGRIEYAEGGTLFLDEIGDLSFSLQVKLLRFLQEHVLERIGGREEIQVDVRILAATNMDLKKAIDEGRFREDLYFRLSVVSVNLPPLRERGNDSLLLARAFLQRYSREFKKNVRGFKDEAVKALSDYDWPGNVRELENRVKRGVVMSDGEWLSPLDLEFSSPDDSSKEILSLHEARETMEKRLIGEALLRHGSNITHAARDLDISRQTLTSMINKYGITVK
ncbi:MAG TPA: PEP-CTERM-box response regulator transcription factor [Nitrospirota bacterium]|nr:PEP-CTERM-box response regulator transcription factor [Nitrospirota bacterium]